MFQNPLHKHLKIHRPGDSSRTCQDPRAALISIFFLKETWWLVVFVFVAQAAGTLAMWTKNGRIIRFAQLFVISPFWLLYDALIPTPSFGGVLCEVFNMTSVIVSFIRFRKTGFDQT